MNHLNKRPYGTTRSECPDCGCPVRQRIDNGKAYNIGAWLLFTLLTCGLGLIALPVFTRPKYSLHCSQCGYLENE